MEEKVFGCIKKYNLIQKGDNVIVALSGGADSIALFHFLYSNVKTLQINLQAAHFDHGLRGSESDRDADFVRATCHKYGVQLHIKQGFMREAPKPVGMGEEEWARHLRLGYLEELAAEQNAKIATAHTLSDNAETVLFRAARGSGTRGIAGIPPARGVFIRPMLQVTRSEVEAYCSRYDLQYVTDSTNASMQYARNRIRLAVLPELERVHPGAEQALARLGETMRGVDEYLTAQATMLLNTAKRRLGHDAAMLLQAPDPVRMQAFALLAEDYASGTVLENMQKVASGQLGALQICAHKRVRLVQKQLVIEEVEADTGESYSVPFKEGLIELPGGINLLVSVEKTDKNYCDEEKKEQKGLTFKADYDRIRENCVFRGRLSGDSYRPAGRGVTKTLKKWMSEEGIPPAQRRQWPLLAQGSNVLWVARYGFCDGVQVTQNTQKIVHIQILQ